MRRPVGRATAPQRRSARRTVAIAVVAVIVAFLIGEVVDQLVDSSGPAGRRTEASWLSAVGLVVAHSNSLAPFVHALRQGTNGLGPEELEALSGELAQQSAQVVTDFDEIGITPPPGGGPAEVATVFAERAKGSAELQAALEAVFTPGAAASQARPTALFTQAGRLLVAADRTYARFRSQFHGSARALPTSVWISSPRDWSRPVLSVFVASLASAASATPPGSGLRLVAISFAPGLVPVSINGLPSITTAPSTTTTTTLPFVAPTGVSGVSGPSGRTTRRRSGSSSAPTTTTAPSPGGLSQIPPAGAVSVLTPTGTLSVAVVVLNEGTIAAPSVRVDARLAALASTAPARSTSEAVGNLAAGASRYLVLPPLALARSVRRFELSVSLSSAGAPILTRTLALEIGA